MTIEHKTRTSDPAYDLASVMYHALQGAETHEHYIGDAARRGDDELEEFFRGVQESNIEIADRAKQLLRARLDA
jgi:hypothetical protein